MESYGIFYTGVEKAVGEYTEAVHNRKDCLFMKVLRSVRDILAGLVILYASEILGMMGASLVRLLLRNTVAGTIVYLLCSTGVYLIAIYVLTGTYMKRVLGMPRREWMPGCKADTLVTWGVTTICLQGVILVLRVVLVPGNWRLLPQNEIPFALLRALIDFGIGAGIAEEMIFRGVLFKSFEERYGRTAAVLIPGIVFALLHIMNRQEPAEMLLTVLYIFALALLLGLIRSRTGSFWPCAAAHGIWNFIYTGCILMGTAGENSPILYYEIASGNYLIIPIIIIALFCAGYATVCRNRQKK